MTRWQENTAVVIARHEKDAEAVGLGAVWEHLIAQDESATRSMLLGIVGALATCLRETGFQPPA